jgi:hypothetical protein
MASLARPLALAVIASVAMHASWGAPGGEEEQHGWSPSSWGVLSIAIWLSFIIIRGWGQLGTWDRQQFFWGTVSAVAFLNYLQHDPDFKGWGEHGTRVACARSVAAGGVHAGAAWLWWRARRAWRS